MYELFLNFLKEKLLKRKNIREKRRRVKINGLMNCLRSCFPQKSLVYSNNFEDKQIYKFADIISNFLIKTY